LGAILFLYLSLREKDQTVWVLRICSKLEKREEKKRRKEKPNTIKQNKLKQNKTKQNKE